MQWETERPSKVTPFDATVILFYTIAENCLSFTNEKLFRFFKFVFYDCCRQSLKRKMHSTGAIFSSYAYRKWNFKIVEQTIIYYFFWRNAIKIYDTFLRWVWVGDLLRFSTFTQINRQESATEYGPSVLGYHSHCWEISLNIHFPRINQFDSFHQTLDAHTYLASSIYRIDCPYIFQTKHGKTDMRPNECLCGHLNMIKYCRFAQVICVTFFLATHRHESHYIFTKAQRQSVSFFSIFTVWIKCA